MRLFPFANNFLSETVDSGEVSEDLLSRLVDALDSAGDDALLDTSGNDVLLSLFLLSSEEFVELLSAIKLLFSFAMQVPFLSYSLPFQNAKRSSLQ